MAGKFQKCGHLRTFQDIQARRAVLEEASMSLVWCKRLVYEGLFSHESSRCLGSFMGLVHVRWDLERDKKYGREVFYEVASAKCQ